MPVYIKDLDLDSPPRYSLAEAEPTDTWDDELRTIKEAYVSEFPNIDGQVVVTQAELNSVTGRILRNGDQMEDQLIAVRAPLDALELATKAWVESLVPTGVGDDYTYGIIDIVEIPPSPLVFGALYTAVNTLTEAPTKWVVKLICVQAEYGYEAGDEAVIGGARSNDTSNNLDVGGVQPFSNDSEVGIQVGDAVYLLDRDSSYPGVFREVTPARWEITGIAIQIGPGQVCEAGVSTQYRIDDHRGTNSDGGGWIDRTNQTYLSYWTGATQQDPARLYVWNMATDTLKYTVVAPDPDLSANNRSSGFGFSSQSDGVIDRYAFSYRRETGGNVLSIRDAADGNELQYNTHFYAEGFRNGYVETTGYIGYRHSKVSTPYYYDVIGKTDALGALSAIEQTSVPPNHDVRPVGISMPDRDSWVQLYKNTSDDTFHLAKFTPSALGGSYGTLYSTGLTGAGYTAYGQAYDGTHGWLVFGNTSLTEVKLLRVSTEGQVLNTYTYTDGSILAGNGFNTVIDYDPNIDKIILFYGSDNDIRFVNPATGAQIGSQTMGFTSSIYSKYSSKQCSAYVASEQGLNDLVIVKSCINCLSS